MELLQDGVTALLAAVGLVSLFQAIVGMFLPGGGCRNPELLFVLPLRGEAETLEGDTRELLRLRNSAPKATIVLADCGMTEEARARALYWCGRERGLTLLRPPIDVTGSGAVEV